MKLPRTFREVMVSRTIEDLKYKMEFIRKVPQENLNKLFFEMCDRGIELYIQSELEKYPDLSPQEIMKKYYLNKRSKSR